MWVVFCVELSFAGDRGLAALGKDGVGLWLHCGGVVRGRKVSTAEFVLVPA